MDITAQQIPSMSHPFKAKGHVDGNLSRFEEIQDPRVARQSQDSQEVFRLHCQNCHEPQRLSELFSTSRDLE